MTRARSWARMLVVLALVGALAAVFAGPAGAYTKRQKRHIQRQLLHQLKKHPRLIKNKHWLRKADHVQEVLPLTIRLNPIVATGPGAVAVAPSDDHALLDFTDTFGPDIGAPKMTTLSGVVHADAHFGNPENGDTLGSVQLVVPTAQNVNTLSAASVGVLTNSAASTCPAPPDKTLTAQAGGPIPLGPGQTAAQLAPSVGADTVVRTAPITLSAASTSAPNVGAANLFSGAVRLSLHVNATVNTIFRVVDDGFGNNLFTAPPEFPASNFNCDEAFAAQTSGTGDTGNIIPVNVTGNLAISPALTTDGRLRIATVNVSTPPDTSGIEVGHSTVNACLQPATLINTTHEQADKTAFIGATGLTDTIPADPAANNPPTTDCDATFNPFTLPPGPDGTTAANFPLSQFGEQPIQGTDANKLHLDPNVDVQGLSGEVLIGTYPF